jgi:hypothetical protein
MNIDRMLGQPVDWTVDTASAANAINGVTRAAVAGKQNVTFIIRVSYSAPVTTAHTILVTDGSNSFTIQTGASTVSSPITLDFSTRPLVGLINTAVAVTVGAAGGGVVSSVNIHGFTQVAQ